MSDQIIVLSDRIKELSHSVGVGNLRLDGAATGFSAFSDFYESGDALYYAVTDGTDYEVGSGQYLLDGSTNNLVRFPFRSTNSDNAVDFSAGVKEIYVTYPGQYAVFTASGLGDFKEPKPSGLAFWGSSQILCYDDELVWSPSTNKLGVAQANPQYAVDIGGSMGYSQIRSSGFFGGGSGIYFSGGQPLPQDVSKTASGGRQLEPFFRNELDNQTGTDAVFYLSGVVDQRLCAVKQDTNTFFAGPPSGCADGSCTPDYPSFRLLNSGDIPDLGDFYIVQDTNMGIDASTIPAGSVALYKESGIVTYDPQLVFLKTDNRLGINIPDPRTTLDVNGAASVSGDIWVSGDSVFSSNLALHRDATISGNLMVSGDFTGDLFQIADNAATSGDVGGQYLLSVSGVSGIHTEFITDVASNSGLLLINPSGLSGVMQHQIDNATAYAGWNLTDGWVAGDLIGGAQTVIISGASGVGTHYDASSNQLVLNASGLSGVLTPQITSNLNTINASGDSLLTEIRANSSSGVVISGIANTNSIAISNSGTYWLGEIRENSASGAAISGWNKVYTDEAVLAAGSYTHWTFTDGTVAGDNITNAQTFTVSGASGVGTHYDASTNMLVLNPSGLSGVLRYDIDNTATYAGWNITDGWVADDLITGGQTVTISGVSGVGTHYDASANMLVLNPSGLSGVLEHRDDIISGVLKHGIDNLPVGGSAGSGLTKVDQVIHMDVNGSGQLEHLMFNEEQIRIGTDAGHLFDFDSAGSYWTAIGSGAGYGASGNDYANMIGVQAGAMSSGMDHGIAIGAQAGYSSSGCLHTAMIGSGAGAGAYDCDYNNIIGTNAGQHATGCYQTNMFGILAGWRANDCDSSTLIGRYAGYLSSGNRYSDIIGHHAGESTKGNLYNTMIGYHAGSTSSGNVDLVMIGRWAGHVLRDSKNSIIIGENAASLGADGLPSTGVNQTAIIGHQAGSGVREPYRSSIFGPYAAGDAKNLDSAVGIGVNAVRESWNLGTGVYIGEGAGSNATQNILTVGVGLYAMSFASGTRYTCGIGTNAGLGAKDTNYVDFIGSTAGMYASGCTYSTMIGEGAGQRATGVDYGVAIGSDAGAYAVDQKNCIYLGYRAGFGFQPGTDNHLIINPSNDAFSANWVGVSTQKGIISIADIIHGQSDGTTKYITIGSAPSDMVSLAGTTLAVRPGSASHVVLRTHRSSSQSADQIQSSITSDDLVTNTIVNRHGWFQLPVALNIDNTGASANAYTHATSTAQQYKIDKDAGVVAYYQPTGGTTKHLIVSDGSRWYTTASLTEL